MILLTRIVILVLFSILIIIDYFPSNLDVSKSISFIIIALVVINSVIHRNNANRNEKTSLISEVILVSYILILISVLTILGGKSSTGISFNNAMFWFVLLLSIIDMISRHNKLKNKVD